MKTYKNRVHYYKMPQDAEIFPYLLFSEFITDIYFFRYNFIPGYQAVPPLN